MGGGNNSSNPMIDSRSVGSSASLNNGRTNTTNVLSNGVSGDDSSGTTSNGDQGDRNTVSITVNGTHGSSQSDPQAPSIVIFDNSDIGKLTWKAENAKYCTLFLKRTNGNLQV